MNPRSAFQRSSEARERSLESLGAKVVTTLVAGGIVNPFGPTLTALLAEGTWEDGAEVTICHLMLNPFSQALHEVGTAWIGAEWTPDADLQPFFELRFGDCPSLLMPSGVLIDSGSFLGTYAAFLGSFEAGFTTLEAVRRFPGNPRGRVQEQIDVGEQMIGAFLQAGGVPVADPRNRRPLTELEAAELAYLLLEPACVRQEMEAFAHAWNQAIRFQGGTPMGQEAMPLGELSRYFDILAASCRFMPEPE